MTTERPQDPFEQASYDLNQFRERRLSDRRFQPRGTADRRAQKPQDQTFAAQPQPSALPDNHQH